MSARQRLALAALCWCVPVIAQEAPDGSAAPAPIAAWTAKPVASLTAPWAVKSRLLSIAQAGKRLVAVGQQGAIVISDDGATWRQVASPVSQMLTRVRFSDANTGWATGYEAVILKTADGGQTWSVQHFESAARPLYDIVFSDPANGIAVGGYGTYLTTADGGKTWGALASPLSDLGLHFNTVQKLEDGSLFLAGEKGVLAHSIDGGANWKMLQSPYAGSFFGFIALGGNKILAYGMRGNVFVSDDITRAPAQDAASWDQYAAASVIDPAQIAALGWQRLANPSKESLFGATRLDSGEVLLVGINGTALKTDLAANQLAPVKLKAEETLTGVVSANNKLIAVGKRGVQQIGESR